MLHFFGQMKSYNIQPTTAIIGQLMHPYAGTGDFKTIFEVHTNRYSTNSFIVPKFTVEVQTIT
jgi:hypothetical protein